MLSQITVPLILMNVNVRFVTKVVIKKYSIIQHVLSVH